MKAGTALLGLDVGSTYSFHSATLLLSSARVSLCLNNRIVSQLLLILKRWLVRAR